MKYQGIELKEFKSDRPVIFDPPKKMFAWDDNDPSTDADFGAYDVQAYIPGRTNFPVVTDDCVYRHCAEIPEAPKPRRANNRELAKWLAQGNGECHLCTNTADAYYTYRRGSEDCCASIAVKIRKWDDAEWHEPTVDYMFGEAE